MSDHLTLDRVVSVIVKQSIVIDEEITEATLFEDLGFDSLDRVEFQFALEEELKEDLTAAEKDLDNVRTIGDLIRVVNAVLDGAIEHEGE